MWLDIFVEPVLWERLRTGDHFLYGKPNKPERRRQQHAELGDERGDECCHHAGYIHVHPGEWFDERESNGDDHIHADGYQYRRLDYVYANRYRKLGKQTNDQFVHGQPHKRYFGRQQHAELGDERGDECCHHAGYIHVHPGEWFDERESNGDDYIHADGYQCLRFGNLHGKSHCHSVRRSAGDHHHFVPRRNTGSHVCRLHHSRQRRHSAVHIFAKHGCHRLSSIA